MFDIPNIHIPIYVFLFVFGAYMLFYLLYSLFNIYHLVRYGVYGFGLYLIITIFTGGTILLVAGSTMLLMEYDWTLPISLNDAATFSDETLFPAL
ncbi:hypothetical protein EPN81_02050 [Patescibacteria group bacterium]|nr:MAG: hypothetical protein EPN81_02050 [Patescibacteria group bacterium]